MRNAFADEMAACANENKKIMLLSGDIGNRLFDNYKAACPNQFINCGIAESNMMGVAAGMALSGLKPVTYTITPFVTMRCFEQIKIDVCYHNLPVILVGVGGGLCYSIGGATHQSCEDVGILRTLPNITILCPGDAYEVRAALRYAFTLPGPVYIRLGKKNEPLIHKKDEIIDISSCMTIKDGSDVCLLSTGNTLPIVLEAGKMLDNLGVSARVCSFPKVKHLETEALSKLFNEFKLVSTIEEHSIIGGFGSAVAEWLSDCSAKKGRLIRIATPDKFISEVGNQDHIRKCVGLTPEVIVKRILNEYKKGD